MMPVPVWLIIALVILIIVVILLRSMNQVYIFSLFKQNFFWFFFVAFLLFLSYSLYHINTNYDISYRSWDGITAAGKIYFTWLKSVFSNLGRVTGYAVNQNWFLNSTGGG